jgi:hypothetical protein
MAPICSAMSMIMDPLARRANDDHTRQAQRDSRTVMRILANAVTAYTQVKAAKRLRPAQKLPVASSGAPVQLAHLAGNPHP